MELLTVGILTIRKLLIPRILLLGAAETTRMLAPVIIGGFEKAAWGHRLDGYEESDHDLLEAYWNRQLELQRQ